MPRRSTAPFWWALALTMPALSACQMPVVDEVAVAMPPTVVQVAARDGGLQHAGPRTKLTVGASGTPAAGGWPELELIVDGRSMGTVPVASETLTNYVFEADVAAEKITEVRVRFANDLILHDKDPARREDRNLYVYYLLVDDARLPASFRTRIDRFDGQSQRGQESLWWNADLIFPVASLR